MVYEYHSPVGGTGLVFYCFDDSEQRAEIWTKLPTIPAATIRKQQRHCLCELYNIRYFSLTETPEPPSSVKKIMIILYEGLTRERVYRTA